MITFYTREEKFDLIGNRIYRNGEVIAEGDLYIHRLLFGQPSLIVVNGSKKNPFVLKTSPVIGVLPEKQYFEGTTLVC